MGELAAYLPIDRMLALPSGQELPDRAAGVVLFADISGFTPLTAILAEELGPQRGAEELAVQLNLVYSLLIDEIYRYGGSAIAFSGDAILCWFDQSTHLAVDGLRPGHGPPVLPDVAPSAPALRAAACAVAMQRVMQRFKAVPVPNSRAIRMGLKIGMAAGPVRRFLVGSPAAGQIETLAGSTLARVAAAEKLASQDEIIAAAELADELGDTLAVQSWRTSPDGQRFAVVGRVTVAVPSAPWAPIVTDDLPAAAGWLLPPVYERLARGEGDFLTELRPVATLFLNFEGIDYDGDDQAGVRLDALVRRVQEVVGRYEGFLAQLTIGDKGSYLYCIFGAPIAHEDDRQRAVASAMDLRALSDELPGVTNLRIGLSYGRMRVGAYGATIRRTYGVLGNETNMAARLMGLASSGQVLISAAVAEAVRDAYDLEDLGMMAVKGRDRLLHVSLVRGRRESREPGMLKGRAIMPMVGRTAELARAQAHVAALRDGRGGCLIIEGEAGIGKSRLVATMQELLGEAGCTITLGLASSIEQASPYYGWRQVFSELLGVDGFAETVKPESRQLWRAHVAAYLARHLPARAELAPLLNVLLPLDLPEQTLTAQMTGEVRATNTRELLTGILAAAAAQAPLAVVIEDAHWLDSASWALARDVLREVPALLLVLVLRPLGQPNAEYEQIIDAPTSEVMGLSAMASDDIATLLRQRLGVTALPSQLVELVATRAEGHPFFSEELAYALRDAGLIVVADGRCVLAPGVGDLRAVHFPDTIEGVIISRIDRLPAQFQLTLKVASVIGRLFAFRILRDVHPILADRAELSAQLSSLEQLDITLRESGEPDLAYFFKHIITQEVAYNLITFAQRRELHRIVARWYEDTYADDLAPFYDLLAYHWGRAEEASRAIDYLERAGDYALHSNANREAVHFFDEALALTARADLAQADLRRARWLIQLGTAHYRLGHMVESKARLGDALALLGAPLPDGQRAEGAALLRVLGQQIRHRLPVARPPSLGPGPDRERQTLAVEAYKALVPIYFITNETNNYVLVSIAALNTAERIGQEADIAIGYATLGLLSGLLRHSWAESYFSHGMALAQRTGPDLNAMGQIYSRRGIYRSTAGRWHEAMEDFSYALSYFRRLNDQRGIGDCLNYYMRVYHGQGYAHLSVAFSVALYTMARRTGDAQHEGWGLMFEAQGLLLLEEFAAAQSSAEQAQAVLGQNISDTDRVNIEGVLAEVALARGETALALRLVKPVVDILLAAPPVLPGISHGFSISINVYLTALETAGPAEKATLTAVIGRLCAAQLRFAHFFAAQRAEAEYWQGRYSWARGHHEAARRWWARALRSAAACEQLFVEGMIRCASAAGLPAGAPERAAQLHRAVACFEATGLAAKVHTTRALLDTDQSAAQMLRR